MFKNDDKTQIVDVATKSGKRKRNWAGHVMKSGEKGCGRPKTKPLSH